MAPMKTMFLISAMAALAWGQQGMADSRPVILAFGDSLTAGYGVARDLSYPAQLQERLDAGGYSYHVVNMGVPGDTTRAARARMDRALLRKPLMVILELGGNDRSSGLRPAQTAANLDEMIRLFRATGATVVLAQSRSGLSEVYRELAGKYGLTLVPAFLEGVEGHADLTIADGRHPNAEGYTIVTETVMRAIEPLLKTQPQH